MITELAEMGVADQVLESITGHLTRRMLEHYSHIRIDAKRQALDALDEQRRRALPEHNGDGEVDEESVIETVVETSDDLTSQSRHNLTLSGSPSHGKLLIPRAEKRPRPWRASAASRATSERGWGPASAERCPSG